MLNFATQLAKINYITKGGSHVSENIHLRVSKAKKDEMAAQAAREGLSMTGFILAAVNDRINRDNHGVNQTSSSKTMGGASK